MTLLDEKGRIVFRDLCTHKVAMISGALREMETAGSKCAIRIPVDDLWHKLHDLKKMKGKFLISAAWADFDTNVEVKFTVESKRSESSFYLKCKIADAKEMMEMDLTTLDFKTEMDVKWSDFERIVKAVKDIKESGWEFAVEVTGTSSSKMSLLPMQRLKFVPRVCGEVRGEEISMPLTPGDKFEKCRTILNAYIMKPLGHLFHRYPRLNISMGTNFPLLIKGDDSICSILWFQAPIAPQEDMSHE